MPNTVYSSFEELQARLLADLDLAHAFVHGTDTQSITTENGQVDCLAKMAKDLPFSALVSTAQANAEVVILAKAHVDTALSAIVLHKNAAVLNANAAALSASTAVTKTIEVNAAAALVAEQAATVLTLKNQTDTKAAAAATYAAALSAISFSVVELSLGAKAFTVGQGKQFTAGQWLVAASGDSALNGQVVSYVGAQLTVMVRQVVQAVADATTLSDWSIGLSGPVGLQGDPGVQGGVGTQGVQGTQGAQGAVGVSVSLSTYLNKSTITSGTVTFTHSEAQNQRLQVAGALTIATAGWPAANTALGVMLIELVNGGAAAITWPVVHWLLTDGTTTTTFSLNGVTLQASGSDFVTLWSRDGGVTVHGKVMR